MVSEAGTCPQALWFPDAAIMCTIAEPRSPGRFMNSDLPPVDGHAIGRFGLTREAVGFGE